VTHRGKKGEREVRTIGILAKEENRWITGVISAV
jgi:hypothetical protein